MDVIMVGPWMLSSDYGEANVLFLTQGWAEADASKTGLSLGHVESAK